jgi:hypothetical protein
MRDFPLDSVRARLTPGQRVQTPRCPQDVGVGNLKRKKKGSIMSELSMHELEAQTGEVLPEREALSAVAIGFGNHATQINNHNTTNNLTSHVTTVNASDSSNATSFGFANTTISSAHQSINVSG